MGNTTQKDAAAAEALSDPNVPRLVELGLAQFRPSQGKSVDFSDETGHALHTLRNKLLTEVGDDILAGTLFAPSAAETPTGGATADGDGPSFTVRVRGHDVEVPCTGAAAAALYREGAVSHLGVEGRGTVRDEKLRRSREYTASEIELPRFLQPEEFTHTFFPEPIEAIRQRLCPDAARLELEVYKLVVYGVGDFFVKHADSVMEDSCIATLLVHLPCRGDYFDAHFSERGPDAYSYETGTDGDETFMVSSLDRTASLFTSRRRRGNARRAANAIIVRNEDGDRGAAATGDDEHDDAEAVPANGAAQIQVSAPSEADLSDDTNVDDDDWDRSSEEGDSTGIGAKMRDRMEDKRRGALVLPPMFHQEDQECDEDAGGRRCEGGALRFFLGRRIDPALEKSGDINDKAGYGHTTRSSTQYVASVLMQNYDARELVDGEVAENPAFANILARSVPARRDRRPAVPLQPGQRRNHTPLHYAAFRTDVLHDVRPLRRGFRIVLQYRVHRRGVRSVVSVPRLQLHAELDAVVDRVVAALRADVVRLGARVTDNAAAGGSSPQVLAFGVGCRHTYPPALLSPANLKGIDLLLYEVLSRRYECLLCLTASHQFSYQPFIGRSKLGRFVVFSAEAVDFGEDGYARLTEKEREKAPDFYAAANTAWIDVGMGALTSGGGCLGNWDCASSFYYKNAAVVCTLQPSAWARRRWAFLAALRGAERNALQRLERSVYPAFRNVVMFL